MDPKHSRQERSPRRLALAALATAAALLVSAAAPARADGDFEDAFEATIGSLLAFEAVQAGKALLYYGAPPVAAPAYYPPPAYAVPVPVAVPAPYPVAYPAYGVVHHHHHHRPKIHHHHYKPPRHHYGHSGHGRHARYRDDD
jgi:hypothetical protein